MMRNPRAFLASAFLVGLALVSAPRAASQQVLITGARVLDVAAGAYLPAAAVLIEDGRISSITKDAPAGVSDDATRIDAGGKTLVPGLADAFAAAAPTPDLEADYFYAMALAHGVTTLRVMNVRTPWGVGQRTRVESGEILAPRLFTSGRGLDQWSRPALWLYEIHDAAEASAEVRRQVASKVDWIAGYENITPDVYRAMAAAVKGTSTRISGRPGASSMAELARVPVQAIDTLAWPVQARPAAVVAGSVLDRRTTDVMAKTDAAWLATPAKDLRALVTQLVRSRAALVPLLAAGLPRAYPDEVKSDAALDLLPEARRKELLDRLAALPAADAAQARQAWDSRLAFVRDVVKAGGRVVTGSGFEDNGYPVPGVGVHREVQALVRAGLSPAEAIRAATLKPAALLGAARSLGQIKPGFQADLIIVEGDPLANVADLARITTVIRAGEVLDPKTLLAQARQAIVGNRPR